ncbi:MAG: hypothetical protein MI785_03130 [Kiloniellales bacterium]|nr:hypothetical protein [Kiloniellales bacterium]
MFAQRNVFSFSRGQDGKDPRNRIKVGSTYRHAGPGDIVETAEVIDVGPDPMGIPHVVYKVEIERGRQRRSIERRTLNLQSFSEHFSEAVEA